MIDRIAPPPPPPPPPPKPKKKVEPKSAPQPKREAPSSRFVAKPAGPTRRETKSTSYEQCRVTLGPPRPPPEQLRAMKENALAAAAVTAASDVSKTAGLDEIEDATNDFKDAKENVDKLNNQQQIMVAELKASGRTQPEIQTAVTAFTDRNRDTFDDYTHAAAKLSGLLDDAHRQFTAERQPVVAVGRGGVMDPNAHRIDVAKEALAQIPALADTKAGSAVIANEVKKASLDQTNLFDDAEDIAGAIGDSKEVLDGFGSAAVQSVATKSLDLAKAGKLDEAKANLEGLRKLEGGVFGTRGGLDKVVDKLEEFDKLGKLPKAQQTAALAKWTAELRTEIDGLEGSVGPGAYNAFKGLGLVLGAVGTAGDLKNFDELSVQNKLRAVSDGLNFGVDAGSTALKIFKNAESAFLETAGKKLPLVGTVFDSIDAFNAFKTGDYVGGASSAALAVGAALTATGVAAPVGIALMAGGALVKLFSGGLFSGDEGDEDIEGVIQQGYKDAGVPDSVAEALDVLDDGERVIGPFLAQLGGDSRAFVDKLAAAAEKDDDVVEDFRKMVQHLDRGDDGRVTTEQAPPVYGGRAGVYPSDTPSNPKSWGNAMTWLADHGLA